MCSYEVSEGGTGAGERVDGMVNETDLAPGYIAGLGASRVAGLWGWRLLFTMSC